MSIDLWFARTFSILIALVALGIAYGSGVVFRIYLNMFRSEVAAWLALSSPERVACGLDKRPTFNTHGVVILTVMLGLECICAAILDVGQAFPLVTEGWGAIVGIIGTLILPLLGYKSIQNVSASKGSPTTVTGGA